MIRCLNFQGEILAPLKPKSLRQPDILTPEASAQRLLSKEVIRVKDAPDMNLLETVRHFTFLLSKKNLQFVKGGKSKKPKNLAGTIEGFSKTIQQALATHYSQEREEHAAVVSDDLQNSQNSLDTENPTDVQHSSARTADVATAMFRESNRKRKQSVSQMSPINIKDRNCVIEKARRCLAWAHDPARPVVPGAEAMTNDQVC